jgi:putative transposase
MYVSREKSVYPPQTLDCRQCRLLDVSRASVYRRSALAGTDDLRLIMYLIGRQVLAAWLNTQGHPVTRKRVQRLMRLMAIYQRPNTSKAAPEHIKYPYLGGLAIDRVNQVWCTDIT